MCFFFWIEPSGKIEMVFFLYLGTNDGKKTLSTSVVERMYYDREVTLKALSCF